MTTVTRAPGYALPPQPEIDDATRRDFLIGAAGLLVLAPYGCGGGETGVGGEDSSSGATRTAEHYYGEAELPVNPRRMVAYLPDLMDYALVLDIPLVGGSGALGYAQAPFVEYQREAYSDELGGLETVQGYPEINFEQVAALSPDCILALDPGGDAYERMSDIAPTFVLPYLYEAEVDGVTIEQPDWKRSLRTVAGAFGRRREADGFMADYRSRAEDLRGRLADRWSGATFATVAPYDEVLYVGGYAATLEGSVLFEDLGLAPAPSVTPDEQELSLEQIPQIDADVLLVSLDPRADEGSLEPNREAAAPITDSRLWQELSAVRKNQAFEYSSVLNYASPLTADAFLDHVERALLG